LTHLYLIRHGDAIEDLKDGTYQDLGLSTEGVKQVERLRDRLARTGEIKADVLIASPLPRAQQSAQMLAPVLGLPITLDEDMQEWVCDDGRLSPEAFTQRWNEVPESQRPYTRWMPGYETWLEYAARVQLAFHRLTQEYEGKTVAIVAHGGIIQVAFIHFLEQSAAAFPPIAANKASITEWFRADAAGRWMLKRFNDAYHG
jgi:probable phosphoglycerate mutase